MCAAHDKGTELAQTSNIGAVGFGLLSATSWGSGDFCGGLAARRAPIYSVIITSQLIGWITLLTGAILLGQTVPPLEHLLWGGVAGLSGAVGLMVLYYGLANGQMAVVAPVSAVVSTIVPVLIGIGISGVPSGWKLLGFVIAMVSVWFISRSENTKIGLRALALPVLAGLSFGLFFVITSRVSYVSYIYPLVAARSASIPVFIMIALLRRERLLVPRATFPIAIGSGILDAGGNLFFVLSSEVGGRVDVAAVLGSLFPAATILLARVVLKEKIGRMQTVGIAMAFVAILLISA